MENGTGSKDAGEVGRTLRWPQGCQALGPDVKIDVFPPHWATFLTLRQGWVGAIQPHGPSKAERSPAAGRREGHAPRWVTVEGTRAGDAGALQGVAVAPRTASKDMETSVLQPQGCGPAAAPVSLEAGPPQGWGSAQAGWSFDFGLVRP